MRSAQARLWTAFVLVAATELLAQSPGARPTPAPVWSSLAAKVSRSSAAPLQPAPTLQAPPPIVSPPQSAPSLAERGENDVGSPRVLFVFPVYDASTLRGVPVDTPAQKLQASLTGSYRPASLAARAIAVVWLDHSRGSGGYCSYGWGWGGFGQCYAAGLAESNLASVIGDYALSSWWGQDARFVRLGEGSFADRLYYALTRVVVARRDAGGWAFASGDAVGALAASGISNWYRPARDRGWGPTLRRVGSNWAGTALSNVFAEFWPDVEGALFHSGPSALSR